MVSWLTQEYGVDYAVVAPDVNIHELRELYPAKTYILLYLEGRWFGLSLQKILAQLTENMMKVLQISEFPLPPIDTVFVHHTDFDEDEVEEQLLSKPGYIIVLQDEGEIVGVIRNDVAADDTTESKNEDVSVTAFHPLSVKPKVEHTIFVYMHLPEDSDALQQDVLQSESSLIPRKITTTDKIKIGTQVTIAVIYDDEAIEFSTNALRKRWNGSRTKFEFNFEALETSLNKQIDILVSIQVEGIEIAQLPISVLVTEHAISATSELSQNQEVKWHQSIFISYSRKDMSIVRQYYKAILATGNEVFLDVESLRSGEDWKSRLREAIEKADFLQLFWSENSASSPYVEMEWKYCLEQHCNQTPSMCRQVIRPVYWTKPLPPPPDELSRFHFAYIPFSADSVTLENRMNTDEFWDRMQQHFDATKLTIHEKFDQVKSNQRKMYQRLSDEQWLAVNKALDTTKVNFDPNRIENILKDIRSIIVKSHRKFDQLESHLQRSVANIETVLSSNLSLQNKLEVSIPIIPFILSWKTELGLGNELEISQLFSSLKSEWQAISQ